MKNKPYSILLWVLLTLFCFRVSAQLIQFFFPVTFLPSFNAWQSGTLSYASLVVFQFMIIALYLRICLRVSGGKSVANKKTGTRLLVLGSTYAFVMVTRYVIKMSLYPTERWFGGCLPIVFHIVLASFLITLGIFHVKRSDVIQSSGIKARILWTSIYTLLCLLIPLWIVHQLLPSFLAHQMGMRRSEYYVTDEKKVPIKTTDGEILYADIYRPERLTPAPTILVRIPLDNNFKGAAMSNLIGRIWAERGYNVVIQGVRGRFHSSGKHIPFATERKDGIATLKWLNKQSWHNGKTGMWGGSYFGYTQWVLSDQDTLGIKALMTQISSSSIYNTFYQGGPFAYESALFWATRSYSDKDTPMKFDTLSKGYNTGPMIEADERVIQNIPFYKEWVKHTTKDAYWINVDGIDRAKQLKAPVLMMAGWYDPFLISQVKDFEDIKHYADKDISGASRLIIGPWSHADVVTMPDGYQDKNYRISSIAPSVEWYDQQLKGINKNNLPPVQLFVMGINQWRYENTFPLERTTYVSWYLGQQTDQTKSSTVTLDTLPFVNNNTQLYYYDPAKPLPSIGGNVLGERAGAKPQNEWMKRQDLLIYHSAVLTENLEVTGKIKLILYVSTDAPNTDFMAKLMDVHPDGTAYNISEGAIRKKYSGKDNIEMIEIELNPTSNVFLKGHQLSLAISSSNYPRYSLNYNTGGNNYDESKGKIAEQKIYSGTMFRSQLILPVIPN